MPDKDFLLPTVAQDADMGEILMLAYSNRESLRRTLETGMAHYWSRSRNALWKKGETSGNTQKFVSASIDCDADALLFKVRPTGPACHTGAGSCFFNSVEDADSAIAVLSGSGERGSGRAGTPGQGDAETRGRGEAEIRLQSFFR